MTGSPRTLDGILRCAAFHVCRMVLGVFCLMTVLAAAQADEKKTAQAGSSVVIATSDKPIINNSGPLKGTVTIGESATTPKTYSLTYMAPKTTTGFTEAVKYSDGTDHTVPVSVTVDTEPPTLTSEGLYLESFKALFVLFVVATILESGLAVIFNWRPFVLLFDERGVKTIVSVLFAFFFVNVFNLDVITRLVNVYAGKDYPVSLPGTLITALVLAGGSSGVNNLLVALGFRSVKTAEQTAPRPPRTEAWIAVRLIRVNAVGPVTVLIGTDPANLPAAGTIAGSSSSHPFLQYFLRDYGRFPTTGGFAVTPVAGQTYLVRIVGKNAAGGDIGPTTWGPHPLALGALVDVDLSL
jgi:hypothetical protein